MREMTKFQIETNEAYKDGSKIMGYVFGLFLAVFMVGNWLVDFILNPPPAPIYLASLIVPIFCTMVLLVSVIFVHKKVAEEAKFYDEDDQGGEPSIIRWEDYSFLSQFTKVLLVIIEWMVLSELILLAIYLICSSSYLQR